MRELDVFYLEKEEPIKSCFLILKEYILNYDKNITEAWKFRMPFFCYKGQMFCYFRINKKDGMPYIGFTEAKRIDHPGLVSGDRARIKILLVDPAEGLPPGTLNAVLKAAINLCNSGSVTR
jgi:hypothetical protein